MSIDRCVRCGDLVDTDAEPESYVQIGDMKRSEEWVCMCQHHREEYEERFQEPGDLDERIAAEIAADPRYNCKKCDWDVDGCTPCEEHSDV